MALSFAKTRTPLSCKAHRLHCYSRVLWRHTLKRLSILFRSLTWLFGAPSAVRTDLAGMSRGVLIPSETELFVDRNTQRYCPLKWPRAQRTQCVTAVTAAFGARFRVARATIVVEKWMRHSFFFLLGSSATIYTTETFSCHWFTGFLFLGFWLWR